MNALGMGGVRPGASTEGAERLWLVLLALVVTLPRLLWLDADPPGDLHVHFITDEGWWAHNARLKVLFGRWIMDEHNPPIYSSPLYTTVLWLVYRVLGVGLYQTRLVSGLAGIATCLVAYLFVRREAGRPAALATAFLLATSYFLLTNNRVGFVESLQLLFATLAVLSALRSRQRPALGAVSGLAFVAALLCKPSAIPVGGVLAGCYLTSVARPWRSASSPVVPWRAPLLCAGAVAVAAAALGLLFVWPHWEGVRTEFLSNVLIATSDTQRLGGVVSRLLWFGYRDEPGLDRFVMSGMFAQEVLLVIAVGALGLRRLLRPGFGRVSPLECCCWLWLGVMLASLAAQSYQPDRRYLLCVPPLAILLGLAAFERREGALAADAARASASGAPRIARWRWVAAWGLAGLALGLYARAWVLPWLASVTSGVSVGKEAGLDDRTLLKLIWAASFAVAAMALVAWRRLARAATSAPSAARVRPEIAVLVLVIAIDVVRLAPVLARPRFTIRDVCRAIGAMAERLPAGRRVAVGNTSDTLALESHLFPFLIREWAGVGMFMNRDGIERFRPALALITERRGKPAGNDEGFSTTGMRVVRAFEYWPDAQGTARLRTTVYSPPDVAPLFEHPGP